MINSTVIGRLVKDPETRTIGNGNELTVFSLVSNNRLNKGEDKPQATFVNCSFFGKRGEVFLKHHSKGEMAIVSGELYNRKYVTKDGDERISLDMVVHDFCFSGVPKSVEEIAEANATAATPTVTSTPRPARRTPKPEEVAAEAEVAVAAGADEYDPFAS